MYMQIDGLVFVIFLYIYIHLFKILKEQCVQSFDQKCEDEYHIVEITEYKVCKQFGT